MKISLQEVGKVLQNRPPGGAHEQDTDAGQAVVAAELPLRVADEGVSTRAEDVRAVKDALNALPEVREETVERLKALVESGAYTVSAEEIADLMVRRALVDSIR